MVELNSVYNEKGFFNGLNLDMDRLHSLEVFSIGDASSTAAVDHFLALGRSANLESDYSQEFRLSVFGDAGLQKSQADGSSFMPAPAIDPLFFGGQDDVLFKSFDVYSFVLPECPKNDDEVPEFVHPVLRWEAIEKYLEEHPEGMFVHPVIRWDDPPPCIIYL